MLGVNCLLLGILGFLVPTMLGLIPNGYTVFDDLLHLAQGVLNLALALFSPGRATATQR